jgi:hypothetical protein
MEMSQKVMWYLMHGLEPFPSFRSDTSEEQAVYRMLNIGQAAAGFIAKNELDTHAETRVALERIGA